MSTSDQSLSTAKAIPDLPSSTKVPPMSNDSNAQSPSDKVPNGAANGKPSPGEANLNPPTTSTEVNGSHPRPWKHEPNFNGKEGGKTFAMQHKLPKLPVPKLQDTCKRYLRALQGLQDPEEHAKTKAIVEEFMKPGGEGEKWQKRLEDYNETVDSYIEEFWYESYLSFSESVVLNLNPFFVLSKDVTPTRNQQLHRAASLILGSLSFVHDLRNEVLEPDTVRGIPLDMSQYRRLFGASRRPTKLGCQMDVTEDSRHIVVIRKGQFYWFDCLDSKNRPCLSDREILKNLEAIMADADKIPPQQVVANAVGLLTTENRKVWSNLRQNLISSNVNNRECLAVVDSALFIVCLDDSTPKDLGELCANFLCGTSELRNGLQVGTCVNRWYDKLQIIVCADGEAGINFEHTGVDGHTVLRYAADVYTELVLLFAKSINPSTPSLFKAKLSPHSRSYKPKPGEAKEPEEDLETSPKKLIWTLTPELRAGVRFAETRLSDLICQNESAAMEFRVYGKNFITRHGFSPDAFVQMAFQAAYYGLYGRVESTYEPAMTKAFLHGRTEAIRTVQPESVHFVKTFCSDGYTVEDKIKALRAACKRHTTLTRECSQGLGQDRHLYAMYCLIQQDREKEGKQIALPEIFSDPGYGLLGKSVLSTSNCGNPALRLFGFGPVTPEGHGIGYIIKDEGIYVCASSKHLQTGRFLANLESYLLEVQKMLILIWKQANQREEAYIDHSGVLRDPRTGKALDTIVVEGVEDDRLVGGFGFYDAGLDVAKVQQTRKHVVGKTLQTSDY